MQGVNCYDIFTILEVSMTHAPSWRLRAYLGKDTNYGLLILKITFRGYPL